MITRHKVSQSQLIISVVNLFVIVTVIVIVVFSGLRHKITAIKMPQQKDIVKIAIQMPGAYPQLIQLDQVSL